MASAELELALDQWFQRYTAFAQGHDVLDMTDSDMDESPCWSERQKQWRPVRQNLPLDFSATEHALSLHFHDDVKVFYGRYWSKAMWAETPRGRLQLLFLWNEDDAKFLLENLIGHVLMKRRLRQPETLFIAATDDEDFMISVDNQTGAIMLEQVGLAPTETLADSLAAFLDQLTPCLEDG